jgi:3-dehydroquinate synthase
LSEKVCDLPVDSVARVKNVVHAIGCPTDAPALDGFEQWMTLMRGDKKTQAGEIKFVLMPQIGQAIVRSAPAEAVQAVLKAHTSATDKTAA